MNMNSTKPRNVWLWWAYFFWGVIATGWCAFFIPDALSAVNIVSDIACVITLVAIFGYITQRPLGPGKAWLVLAPIVIAIQAAFFIYTLITPLGAVPVLVAAMLGTALFAPSVWAIYAYAFRSAHVWRGVHA